MAPRAGLLAAAAAATAAAATRVSLPGGLTVQLDPFGANSVRVRLAPNSNPLVDPPIPALNLEAPPPSPHVSTPHPLGLDVGNLRVEVDPTTGYVTATRLSDGATLLQQVGFTATPVDLPGARAGAVAAGVTFAGHGASERIYGLGEHQVNTVQMLPWAHEFAQSLDYSFSHGSDVTVPWYASSLGYGFVWNTPAYGRAKLTAGALTWEADALVNVDFWVTTTPAGAAAPSPFAALLAQYVDAVGHAPAMPYYATGFIQCKDRYRNQSQLLDVARGYVSRQLPISTIVIDWMHWRTLGDWSFNPTCWPDPAGMATELATLGIEPMVTFWPFSSNGSAHWDAFSAGGYLVRLTNGTLAPYDTQPGFLVDQTLPAARNATFDAFWQGYGQYGFKTVWLDAAEPEHWDLSLTGRWQTSAGLDSELMMGWVQRHVRSFAEGFAARGIGPSDYFVLPRSGWAGTWRYSAALWSGDIQGDFPTLELQIKGLQQVAMSGIALWTTDIGGYWGSGDPTDPQWLELITRWFQFGAFCPLFRLHGHRKGGPPSNECGGTNGDNEVWSIVPEGGENYQAIVTMMHLRENLREYVSQINAEAAATGMPMVRPMFLAFPDDPACADPAVEDQFMFGPSWLVAPVYTANTTSRSVYLPSLAGTNTTWVYFFNGSSVGPGGGRVTVTAPVSEFPLFARLPITDAVTLAPTAPAEAGLALHHCWFQLFSAPLAPSDGDSQWVPVPGAAPGTLRLESVTWPGYFIAVDAGPGVEPTRLGIVQAPPAENSTFTLAPGAGDASKVTLVVAGGPLAGMVVSHTPGTLQGQCAGQFAAPAGDALLAAAPPGSDPAAATWDMQPVLEAGAGRAFRALREAVAASVAATLARARGGGGGA